MRNDHKMYTFGLQHFDQHAPEWSVNGHFLAKIWTKLQPPISITFLHDGFGQDCAIPSGQSFLCCALVVLVVCAREEDGKTSLDQLTPYLLIYRCIQKFPNLVTQE